MKLCRAICAKMYADSSAVRAIEPAAYAAVTVCLPAIALFSLRLPFFSAPNILTQYLCSVNDEVRIRLKWGQEYTGLLVSVDSYMNIQLSNAEEWIDGKSGGSLGQVLIRCNNVLWISANNKAKKEDVEMS